MLVGAVREFNGGADLLTPQMLACRLGVNPDVNPGVVYLVRRFGIRT